MNPVEKVMVTMVTMVTGFARVVRAVRVGCAKHVRFSTAPKNANSVTESGVSYMRCRDASHVPEQARFQC
jgi:hypothetical protein